MLIQQLLNALALGCVYALFALGFTLVFGVLGVINLAHGAVFTVGAYLGLQVVAAGWPLWLACATAMLGTAFFGVLMDVVVLRPLRQRDAPHLIPMIATIGVGISLVNVLQGVFGAANQRFPQGSLPEGLFSVDGAAITMIELAIILLSFSMMALMLVLMRWTSFGRALRAVAESAKAAHLLGIHVQGIFMATAAMAAGLGGLAGVFVGLYSNAIFPQMGQAVLHKGIAVIILGGMGDIRGAMFAGLFLGLAEVLAVAYIGSAVRDAVAFSLLFGILVLRPTGLFGSPQQRKA
jgi:branched-chain amino acid transport system permease protein